MLKEMFQQIEVTWFKVLLQNRNKGREIRTAAILKCYTLYTNVSCCLYVTYKHFNTNMSNRSKQTIKITSTRLRFETQTPQTNKQVILHHTPQRDPGYFIL